MFCSFVFRLKSSLQKNNLSSSKLVLIQFGYRGVPVFLFLVVLLGCGLGYLVSFSKFGLVYNSFPTGLKESLKRVKVCYSCYQ